MKEKMLHLAWKHLLFDPSQLKTTVGAPVGIVYLGRYNTDQGPDFLDAQIRIGDSLWLGSVEMHLTTEDWYRHGHETDPNYNSVILHVVGKSSGEPVFRSDGFRIPEVEITSHLNKDLQQRAAQLSAPGQALPCAPLICAMNISPEQHMESWAEQALKYRSERISALLRELGGDWHQLLWQETGAYLATQKNREAFRELARKLPYRAIRPALAKPEEVTAMLNSVMGGTPTMVPRARDLQTAHIPFHHFRMRPGSFPERRALEWVHWFTNAEAWERWMLKPGWRDFVAIKGPLTGISMKQVLFMNVWLPAAIVYQQWIGQAVVQRSWIQELKQLPPEQDTIIRKYCAAGFPARHAADTMALHHLWKSMCSQWNCVTCALGSTLLTSHGNISRPPHRYRPRSQNRS